MFSDWDETWVYKLSFNETYSPPEVVVADEDELLLFDDDKVVMLNSKTLM